MDAQLIGWLLAMSIVLGSGTGMIVFLTRRSMVQDNRIFDFNEAVWKAAVKLELPDPLNTILLLPAPLMRGGHTRRSIEPNTLAGFVRFPWLREMFYVPSIEALERVIDRKMTDKERAGMVELLKMRTQLAHELARDMEKSAQSARKMGASVGTAATLVSFIVLILTVG